MSANLLDAVIAVARDAADLAMSQWTLGAANTSSRDKVPGEPVCDGDIAVNDLLRARLAALVPDAAWLSEETVDSPERLEADRLWIVDPIDGTRDYVRGRTGWAISIALVEHRAVRLGILAAPARGELWAAEAGKGATRNGKPIRASRRSTFTGARVPTDSLSRVDADLFAVNKPNSIALRMAMVAADEADLVATIRWGNEWDVAAASLIAQEAGATVTDALGRELRFNRPAPTALGVLCCASAIHADAVERLSDRARAVLKAA